jgi:hypothetical protein
MVVVLGGFYVIKIIMNNGTVYINDPKLGWNLDRIEDIQDCLDRTGMYARETALIKYIKILKKDVKEIVKE